MLVFDNVFYDNLKLYDIEFGMYIFFFFGIYYVIVIMIVKCCIIMKLEFMYNGDVVMLIEENYCGMLL